MTRSRIILFILVIANIGSWSLLATYAATINVEHENGMYTLINQHRAKIGSRNLYRSPCLQEAARATARRNADERRPHDASRHTGGLSAHIARYCGGVNVPSGEIVHSGGNRSFTAESAFYGVEGFARSGYMLSDPHRAILENDFFAAFGVGTAYNSDYTYNVVIFTSCAACVTDDKPGLGDPGGPTQPPRGTFTATATGSCSGNNGRISLKINGAGTYDTRIYRGSQDTNITRTVNSGTTNYTIPNSYARTAASYKVKVFQRGSQSIKYADTSLGPCPASTGGGSNSGGSNSSQGTFSVTYADYNSGATRTGTSANINHNWGSGSPINGIGRDYFQVAWRGSFTVPSTGTYTFYSAHDDDFILYVNDQLVINEWQTGRRTGSGRINLKAGQRITISASMFENTGNAYAKLSWSGPGLSGTPVFPNRTDSSGGSGGIPILNPNPEPKPQPKPSCNLLQRLLGQCG